MNIILDITTYLPKDKVQEIFEEFFIEKCGNINRGKDAGIGIKKIEVIEEKSQVKLELIKDEHTAEDITTYTEWMLEEVFYKIGVIAIDKFSVT